MKKKLLIILFLFISLFFSQVNASIESSVNKTMDNFYTKLEAKTKNIDTRIDKLNEIAKKIKRIKIIRKWKLSNKTTKILDLLSDNLKKRISKYEDIKLIKLWFNEKEVERFNIEARDAKRYVDINWIAKKINIELTKWKEIEELISIKKTYKVIINWKEEIVKLWVFEDSLYSDKINWKTIYYPIAYSSWWSWKWAFEFFEIATFSGEKNKAIVIWNYYKLSDWDSEGLIINKDWEVITNWWSALPY